MHRQMFATCSFLSSLLVSVSSFTPTRSVIRLYSNRRYKTLQMSNKSNIIIVGSANYDLNAYCQNLPQIGETTLGNSFYVCPGGKGANQAVAAARLNSDVRVHMICKVGRDSYGSDLLENFDKSGVLYTSDIVHDVAHTGVASITIDNKGENHIVVIPGANYSLDPISVKKELEHILKDSNHNNIVMTQLEIPIETAITSLKTGKDHKALTILNPAPALTLDSECFKYIDILIPNESELRKITGDSSKNEKTNQELAEDLLERGINKAVIVTLGDRGALVAQRSPLTGEISSTNVRSPIEINQDSVIDTVGAGDAFCGAFSVYLSSGLDVLESVSKACGVAGITVQSKGAQSSYPTVDALPSILQVHSHHKEESLNVKHKKQITFVTGNKKKLEEVQQILSGGNSFDIVNAKLDLPELQGDPIEIAIEKCKLASKSVKGPVFTEDTSLCFNALNGLPGPYIKWFLEKCGHDGLNQMLDGFSDRSAYAQTIIAFTYGEDEKVHIFDGRTDGTIVRARGKLDFGWDPIFEPKEGQGERCKTYAEMTKEEKNAISHRAKSFAKFKDFLWNNE
jgi:ribokinase/non-canonical purine NTP pyrophosphatase (RdgB/HAM1 family)